MTASSLNRLGGEADDGEVEHAPTSQFSRRGAEGPGKARLRGAPRLPHHHVPRPHLVSRLRAAESVPVVVVRAPAGYGKSTILSEWVHDRAGSLAASPTIWVTVDETCDTRLRFWDSVDNLLGLIGLTPATGAIHADSGVRASLPAILLRVFETLPEPVTLVIDSYERLVDDDVEKDVLRLVRDTRNLHLVVATRRSSGLESAAMGLSLSETALTLRDLAFTRQETRSLAESLGAATSSAELDVIHSATDGWPLAVRDALHLPIDHSATIETNLDVIRTRLLESVPSLPGIRYLIVTTVVDSFTPRLAEALGADPRDIHVLDQVEAKGLGGWEADGTRFRVHPMLREVLASRLTGDLRRTTFLRLAEWHAAHDRLPEAFVAAIRAGRFPLAVRYARSAFPETAGVVAQNPDVLAELPEQVIRENPMLALLSGVGYYAIGNLPRALKRLLLVISAAEILSWGGTGKPSVDQVWGQAALTIALRLSGRYELVKPSLRRFMAMLRMVDDPDDVLDSHELLFAVEIAVTLFYLDRTTDAVRVLSDVPPRPRTAGRTPKLRYFADSLRALVLAAQGEVARARSALDVLSATEPPHPISESFYPVPRHLATACISLEEHDLETAADAVGQCLAHWPTAEIWPYILEVRARVVHAQAGPAAALEVLESGLAEKHQHPAASPALLAMLDATKSELLLAAHRVGDAQKLTPWNRRRTYPRIAVAHARALLIRGQFHDAVRTVDQHLAHRRSSVKARVELLLLRASGKLRLGDDTAAQRSFSAAVEVATPTGLRLPFAAMPRDDFRVLGASLPPEIRDFIERMPDYFPVGIRQNPLTERERVILVELAGSGRMSDIARELSISLNTAKSHVRALYRKLGVNTRDDAVDEAHRRHYL